MSAHSELDAHGSRCVCTECPRTLDEAVREARAKPAATSLNKVQRRHLAGFVKNWNACRVLRGLPPMLADDALTEGLSSLERITADALASLKESKI